MHRTRFFENCFAVFQGGGCRGAAYVGAYEAALRAGIHFSEVAGASAGSIVAALIGAGANVDQLDRTVRSLDFSSLLSPPEGRSRSKLLSTLQWLTRATPVGAYIPILSHLGMHSSVKLEKWLDEQLHGLRPDIPARKRITFEDLALPTWIVATDLREGQLRVWSTTGTPEADVVTAVCASSAIPLFFQAINGCVDGGLLSNLPSFVFSYPEHVPSERFSRILAFTLQSDKTFELTDIKQFINALVDAIVEGSKHLQSSIQGGVYRIEIPTGTISATDFDAMSSDTVDDLIESGRKAVEEFLSREMEIVSAGRRRAAQLDDDRALLLLTEQLERTDLEVIIAQSSLEWVRTVYPSLLWWRIHGVTVRVAVPRPSRQTPRDVFYQEQLRAIGVEFVEAEAPFECFLLRSRDPSASLMLLRPKGAEGRLLPLAHYTGHSDPLAMNALMQQVLSVIPLRRYALSPLMLRPGREHVWPMVDQLRAAHPYSSSDVTAALETVNVSSLYALTDRISSADYVQARHLKDLYDQGRVQPFEPAEVEGATRSCVIPPPVVEESGGRFVITEGLARAAFCRNNGIPAVQVLVVRNVRERWPGSPIPLRGVRILDSREAYPTPPPELDSSRLRHPRGAFQLLSL